MLVRPDGSSVGRLGDEILDAAVLDEAPDVFRRHSVETVYVDRSGQRLSRLDAAEGDIYRVMLEVHERPATLLIVGGRDTPVIGLNREAMRSMRAVCELEIVPGATHLFEEPGALDQVAALAAAWFGEKLRRPGS